jgi:uncharacterized protein
MPGLTTFLLTLCFFLVLVGFVGIFFPVVPSIPLIWFGILLYGLATNFAVVDGQFLLLISVLGLVVVLLDLIAYLWGGKPFSANFWGVSGAVVGGLVGSFFGLFYGLVVGPVFGAIIGQLLFGRDALFAIETKRYIIIGYVGGTIIKIAVGVAMVGLFIWRLSVR